MDEKQRELYYGLYRRMYAFGTLSLRQLKAIYTDNANNESKFAAAGDNAYESFKASQSALFEVIQKSRKRDVLRVTEKDGFPAVLY